MITPIRRQAAFIIAAGLTLAACASKPVSEMPAAASATSASAAAPVATAGPAAQPKAAPADVHEASAQCWMKYDKTAVNLDAKAKLVDKCIDDKMKGR
jgi:ABC-type glycerol-3-phosphate transport system substrate-binding protein